MQTTLHLPPLAPSAIEVRPHFNVVMIYEDFECGKRAMRIYDYLVANLGSEFTFDHQMWKFDVLKLPKLREMAVSDAAAADIILVSTRQGEELPTPVKTWVDSWLPMGCEAIALVALFDGEPERAGGAFQYLSAVACKAGIQFFAHPEEWQSPGANALGPESEGSSRSGRAIAALTTYVNPEAQPPPRQAGK